jgi:Mn-containing catalase
MTDMKSDIQRYLANWQKEIDGAAMYRVLAETEKQPQMKEVYLKLAASEEKHAAAWEKKLTDLKVALPPHQPTWRTATLIWLAKRFGPQFVPSPATKRQTAAPMTVKPTQRQKNFHWKKNPTRACWQWQRIPAAGCPAAPLLNLKDVTKPAAATPCGQPCWAQTTASSPS